MCEQSENASGSFYKEKCNIFSFFIGLVLKL